LKKGYNAHLIVGKNAGAAQNDAGLIFEASITLPDGKEETVATSADWQMTAAQPDAKGKFNGSQPRWQSALEIKPAAVWTSRVGQALPAMLQQASAGPLRIVRASLLKSDAFIP